jgi:hypothetical protein
MNWQDIKGISQITDFSEYYLEHGPINRSILFQRPDREKFGYLWDIPAETLQNIGNIGSNFTGILITNDFDARVVLGLYNRVFFRANNGAMINELKNPPPAWNYAKPAQKRSDQQMWQDFNQILHKTYSADYTPVKKFLSDPVTKKIWIPLFKDYGKLDKIMRKNYYQTIKWIIGDDPLILELPYRYEDHWTWVEGIQEGPMENPELLFIENFATDYPASIKYIPQKIQDKLGIRFLGQLGDLGVL